MPFLTTVLFQLENVLWQSCGWILVLSPKFKPFYSSVKDVMTS